MGLFTLRHFICLIGCLAGSLVGQSNASSCEYTVRDIGFVDLGRRSIRLSLVTQQPSQFDANEIAGIRTWLESWSIEFRFDATPASHDIGQSVASDSTAKIFIEDENGRQLELWSGETPTDVATFKELVNSLLVSPSLSLLRENALKSFAQVVVFESQEQAKVNEALAKLKEASEALSAMLPRPISLPTNVVRIPFGERKKEALLAWLVGAEDTSNEDAVVAMLYGRGQMAGPCMFADKLTFDELLAQFALIGQSCECQSQRKWYSKHFVPMPWTPEDLSDAERALGFHPESLSVIAEAKRIVGRDQLRAGDWDNINDEVDSLVESFGARTESNDGLTATVISGDGWGFEQESTPSLLQIPTGHVVVSSVTTDDNPESSLAEHPESTQQSQAGSQLETRWTAGLFVASIVLAGIVVLFSQLLNRAK